MAKTVHHQELKTYFGDEDHLTIAQNTSFAALIFETLSEQKPTAGQLKVFELILNLSIDHGPDTQSAIPLIEKTKQGGTLQEALSEGIMHIDSRHGGAVEPCMEYLYKVKETSDVNQFITETVEAGKKLAGLGHRLYKETDPRTDLIEKICQENGISIEYFNLARQIRDEFKEQTGKYLVINIDGAIAAVLCAFGWEPRLSNEVFIIARIPGFCAHYLNNSK